MDRTKIPYQTKNKKNSEYAAMRNIKLTIYGEFWDSQIYSKNLYIFGDTGDMYIINWDDLINQYFHDKPDLETVAHVAFLESNLFYTKSSQVILKAPEIRDFLKNKFITLSQQDINLDIKTIDQNLCKHQDNPFPFPHADSEIYYSKLYVVLKDGVFAAPYQTITKSSQLWDAPVFNISASDSYGSIALAAGSEGLYETRGVNTPKIVTINPKQVSPNHCSSCDWSNYNINSSSHFYSSFFAAYKKIRDTEDKTKINRQLDSIILTKDIFNATGYSWGSHDKLYMYTNGEIKTRQYIAKKDGTPSFNDIGSLSLENWKGSVVSASVAPFGTIIECDNAIIVIRSDGEVITFKGEPVNWRVFSNSKYYTNQLHIIYDDRLEIHSFYHDYFINQNTKKSGISMSQGKD